MTDEETLVGLVIRLQDRMIAEHDRKRRLAEADPEEYSRQEKIRQEGELLLRLFTHEFRGYDS